MGDQFGAFDSSYVNLIGNKFVLDGSELEGLIVGEPFTITNRDVTLSGLLADGSPFSFELNSTESDISDFFSRDATLRVTLVPEPSCIVLAFIGTLLIGPTSTRFRKVGQVGRVGQV